MLRKSLAMWGCGVVGEMNKPTGPACSRRDDRGEGHWLREEQPGGCCPDSVIRGKCVEVRGETQAVGVPVLPKGKEKLF